MNEPTIPASTTSEPSATAPVRVQPDCSAFTLLREILTKDREAIQEMRATASWYQPPAELLDLHKRIEACLSQNTRTSDGATTR
jgi:hypothetical protein